MLRIDTLRRSFLLLAPSLALVAACGGGVDGSSTFAADPSAPVTDETGEPTTAPETTAPETTDETAEAEGTDATDGTDEPTDPSAEGADEVVELGDAPVDPEENAPDQTVALSGEGVPLDELEGGEMQVEGREGDDQGLVETLAALDAEPPAEEPVDPAAPSEIAQTSDALLSTRGTKLAKESRRQVDFLKRSTSYYSHTTYMNETTGTRRADCVGFVSYALKRVLPDAFKLFNSTGPTPAKYVDYLRSRPTSASTQTSARWRRITSVRNLKAGDLVGWKNPPGSRASGHVMIVAGTPRAGRSSRGEWIVPVIDSTSSPHNYRAWDSRGTRYTGVGQGQIGLKIDSSGAPKAYYWTGGYSGTAVYRTIALGRVE